MDAIVQMDRTTLTVVLCGLAVAVAGILILRLGKRLAAFLLAAGGLAVAGAVALSMLGQAQANRETAIAAQRAAEAAQIASSGQSTAGAATSLTLFVLVLLLIVLLVGGGALAAFLWVRWRMTAGMLNQWAGTGVPAGALYPRVSRRRGLPPPIPVVYIVESDPTDVDNLAPWDLEETGAWSSKDWLF